MNREFRELVEEETGRTIALQTEETPPGSLEEKILGVLKERHLVAKKEEPKRFAFLKMGLAFAGSAALVVLGIAIGVLFIAPAGQDLAAVPATGNTSDFILLLRSSPSKPPERTPEIIRQRVSEYSAWARGLAEKGTLLQGEKLKDETRLLNSGREEGVEVKASNSENGVEGFFVIRAKDIDEAARIAETCPHYKYGGRIEVREFDRSTSEE